MAGVVQFPAHSTSERSDTARKAGTPAKKQGSRETLSADALRSLHRQLVYPRLIEEKMLLLLRQGKISKWFSGIGQEAIAVGCTAALEAHEYILPLHRNLGVFTTRGVPLSRLFAQWQGTASGFTKGRDRSFHFGTNEYHLVGMISHLGPQLCVADGIALAARLRKAGDVTLVFSGEGGTSEGDFHEALNVASVWDLPVIFVVENNGYGLSTPTSQQYRCAELQQRAAGYGIEGRRIDGNNLLEVYQTVNELAASMRKQPRPVLLECMTFRMRGHEEASGVKYVPPELFVEWAKRDPIFTFEQYLLTNGVLTAPEIEQVRYELKEEINRAIDTASIEPAIAANTSVELADVYAPDARLVVTPSGAGQSKRRFVDAVSDGLRAGLRRYPNLIIMGQDIAEYGGVFKVTEGFLEEFGAERIRNTPLCESAILGAALGLSIAGFKSVVEMQFADFVSCGFNQIVNNLAKVHYRWGQAADVVVRMPTGAGSAAGPFHSQSNEAWFTHTPGLTVVYPSTPYDAKGMLLAAIASPNPVLFFEHKGLYRSSAAEIPDDDYTVPIGVARLAREGSDVAIITYGMGVVWAEKWAAGHPEVSVAVLDLRTLVPLDYEAIRMVVKRTGRVVVLHEDTELGGFGGEIAAFIGAECFTDLDAPVLRCASLDTPVPFVAALEQNFLAAARLDAIMKKVLEF